ncbi:hypothetical protein AL035_17855 [Salipiger aestuarii]|uniref:Uncharacterized protein n=1 Tax=Salipiger aestuarii TaxID=568098 RepID=A0A327YU61_9RHOB|nr:hypothetical protein [Salipiger aestuarii]KAB2539672.1 hypothetical protein AL035_17855 [Salipiger aestuarii]RAK24091.1 hypothetical protein ATI53_1001198 [Salipiger aestuarii]
MRRWSAPDNAGRAEDERFLEAMHRHEVDGMSFAVLARDLCRSRAAVCGMFKRVRDAEQPCQCVNPENRDGGMPPRWWRKCP